MDTRRDAWHPTRVQSEPFGATITSSCPTPPCWPTSRPRSSGPSRPQSKPACFSNVRTRRCLHANLPLEHIFDGNWIASRPSTKSLRETATRSGTDPVPDKGREGADVICKYLAGYFDADARTMGAHIMPRGRHPTEPFRTTGSRRFRRVPSASASRPSCQSHLQACSSVAPPFGRCSRPSPTALRGPRRRTARCGIASHRWAGAISKVVGGAAPPG